MIKKKQLRDFLNNRRNAQISKLAKERDKVENEELTRLLVTKERPIEWWEEFYDEAADVKKVATDIVQEFKLWYGPTKNLATAGGLATFDTFMDAIKGNIQAGELRNSTINKARNDFRTSQEKLENEYSKLQGVIDGGTDKQAYEYLKEVGFDLSEVADEPKRELVAVKPNLEVLGLPEIKE